MNTTTEMGFNWESEKRRLLAALESDFDPRDPTARAERVRIEDVLRSTELAIDEKDREIEHWKKRCEELECQAAEQPDAAERAQLLDADEVIQQERARLRQLEDQLQEKLRLAEIELSVERAKLARKQVELEALVRPADNASTADPPRPSDRKLPCTCGRWLARLGLTEADRERRRPR